MRNVTSKSLKLHSLKFKPPDITERVILISPDLSQNQNGSKIRDLDTTLSNKYKDLNKNCSQVSVRTTEFLKTSGDPPVT